MLSSSFNGSAFATNVAASPIAGTTPLRGIDFLGIGSDLTAAKSAIASQVAANGGGAVGSRAFAFTTSIHKLFYLSGSNTFAIAELANDVIPTATGPNGTVIAAGTPLIALGDTDVDTLLLLT